MAPNVTKLIERSWRGRKDKGKSVLFGWFNLVWFRLVFLIFFWGKGKGQIWRNWEMSGIGVHDRKFPRNQ